MKYLLLVLLLAVITMAVSVQEIVVAQGAYVKQIAGSMFAVAKLEKEWHTDIVRLATGDYTALSTLSQELSYNCDEKVYYIDTQIEPVKVNTKIKNGYKIIGRCKLHNPHPRAINSDDIEFIKNNLERWLNCHYQNSKFSSYLKLLNLGNIRIKLDYVFTILLFDRILEGDIYALTVTDDKQKKITVYIAKALCDSDDYSSTEEKLVYPFFDEKWHLSISNPKPYKIGDVW